MGECNKTDPALKGRMGIKRQFQTRPLLRGRAIICIYSRRLVLRRSATTWSGSDDWQMFCFAWGGESFTKCHQPEIQPAASITQHDITLRFVSFEPFFACATPPGGKMGEKPREHDSTRYYNRLNL